jgi:tetratricopeptide (TPR) repeat protein
MRLFFLGLLISFGAACGGRGASAEDVERSMAEFRLAATLHEEGNTPAAMERLNQAIQLDPENGEAHVLLGYILLQRRAFSDAEQQLRTGIEVLEGRENVGGTLPEAHNVLGLCLLEQDRYDESIEEFKLSAADMLNRQPWNAWANLGLAYFEKGSLDESAQALRQAVEIQPQFCVGHFLLGQTYFAQDEFDDAETAATSAIEANAQCAGYAAAFRLRGEVRARLGHRDEAISDLERCVQLAEGSEDGAACRRILDHF